MNKEELQKKCANLIGVSASEKELAFEVLQEKILEQLKNDGDALRISKLGVFQFKVNKEENSDELIFSPIHSDVGSKTLFLRLPVKKISFDDQTTIEDIFSLSVGKPTVPLKTTFETGGESDSSFIYIKKKIEERVNEILGASEFLSNFNLWDDYLRTMNKETQKSKTESDSSSLLHDLTEPDPEPEEEEMDSYTKSYLSNETELYSYPVEEEKAEKENDEFDTDYETFKNLTDDDDEEEDENIEYEDDNNKEVEEEKVDNDIEENKSNVETNTVDEEESNVVSDAIKPHDEIETFENKLDDEPISLDEDEIFDLEKTVFNNPEPVEDKVNWNWGDELKSKVPEEESPVVKKNNLDEKTSEEEKESPGKTNEKIDEDPFGTLEKTIEQDPEFRTLTSELPEDELKEEDKEYRITNLKKPRQVPPKPKTRITRLTSPIEEPAEKATNIDETEEREVYKSFRERNSNSNVFVIGGIIVILVVIIYFAFSMGDEPSKDIIKPTNQSVQTQTDENIVSSEQPVNKTTVQNDKQITNNNSSNAQPDNSSKVEEIRISNLIFRRGNEYNVQVSSWRSSIKANAEVKRLKARGYKAFVVQAYLPSKGGTWHRVRIGGFKSEEEARNFLNNTQL